MLTLWDVGSSLAVLSIILLSSSLILASTHESAISKRRLELTGEIVGLVFLAVAFYLMLNSLG